MAERQPKWLKSDLAYLKDAYESGVPISTIADTLRRTGSAVRTRAQIEHLNRPGRTNPSQVNALLDEAQSRGLRRDGLPSNPSALKIAILLAANSVASKKDLDKTLGISSSTRNKALQVLISTGLVFIDDSVSPGEVVLTHAAFAGRVELPLDRNGFPGQFPTAIALTQALNGWLPKVCGSEANRSKYGELISRQLPLATYGDIQEADFFALFSNPSK